MTQGGVISIKINNFAAPFANKMQVTEYTNILVYIVSTTTATTTRTVERNVLFNLLCENSHKLNSKKKTSSVCGINIMQNAGCPFGFAPEPLSG